MNRMQLFLANTMQRYGRDRLAWPLWRRCLLSVFSLLNLACRQDWQAAQDQVNASDTAFRQAYNDGVAELDVSSALARRLNTITAQAQYGNAAQSGQQYYERELRFWQISFASAMASAMLGVVIGAGGYVEVLSDADVVYLETSMNYEVSDWLGGDSL